MMQPSPKPVVHLEPQVCSSGAKDATSVNDNASRAPQPVLTGEERRGRHRAKAPTASQIERSLEERGPSASDVAGTEGGRMTNADDQERAVRQRPSTCAIHRQPN